MESNLEGCRPLFFETGGLADLHINEHFDLDGLFDCVDISKLSIGDLQRVGRLCRELCNVCRTDYDIELAAVQKLGEKVIDRLLELDSNIPNIPVALYERIPHSRKDVLFIFSHLFHETQESLSCQASPEFADQISQAKWRPRVHLRGFTQETRGKYASCVLYRTAEKSTADEETEQTMFKKQIIMDFGNSSHVHSQSTAQEDAQRYSDGPGWGSVKLAPSSTFSGKNAVTVGVLIYFESGDNDLVGGWHLHLKHAQYLIVLQDL